MLVKFIRCRVAAEHADAFSDAQSVWSEMAGTAGFLGQTGGWAEEPDDATRTACIVAVWQHPAAHAMFMRDGHDAIVERTGQLDLITSLDVTLFDVMFTMNATADPTAITNAHLLRIADCHVQLQRQGTFVRAQQEIWNPAMAETSGMVQGFFSRDQQAAGHFLVTSWWSDVESHAAYVRDTQPRLREQAQPDQDVRSLTGWAISLEEAWRIERRTQGV